jgi:hypothetical protein
MARRFGLESTLRVRGRPKKKKVPDPLFDMRNKKITARLVRRGEKEDSFDREFWRSVGHEARFAAAWEMVDEVRLVRGRSACEPGLRRSVQNLQRRTG